MTKISTRQSLGLARDLIHQLGGKTIADPGFSEERAAAAAQTTDKLAMCAGCRNDFYNDKNPLGVKRCWSLESATPVIRYRTGFWTVPSTPDAFARVEVLDCYHTEGLSFQKELPAHLRPASLWVDDSKPCPEGYAVARTYDDALRMLRRFDYDVLYLDHDLGEDARTGYDLLKQLVAENRVPPRVECISWNPVGRRRIEALAAEISAAPEGDATR
jgi:hypothetical protein